MPAAVPRSSGYTRTRCLGAPANSCVMYLPCARHVTITVCSGGILRATRPSVWLSSDFDPTIFASCFGPSSPQSSRTRGRSRTPSPPANTIAHRAPPSASPECSNIGRLVYHRGVEGIALFVSMSERICTSCTLVRSVLRKVTVAPSPISSPTATPRPRSRFRKMHEIPIVGKQPHPVHPRKSRSRPPNPAVCESETACPSMQLPSRGAARCCTPMRLCRP